MSKDYLTEDSLTPVDQKFVCISYLKAKDSKELSAIKVRGVFSNYEKACEFSSKLQSVDPYFDIYVGDMGKWLPVNPDNEQTERKYADPKLNEIMEGYIKGQEQAKILHEQRKNEMIRDNIMANITNRAETLESLKNDTENDNSKSIEASEQQLEELNKKKEELDGQIEDLKEQLKKTMN